MRLHRLQLNAFGPFAGAESVDFDELAASGLFLLHGPTGAGKSSVLDAVCYALYGRLPGARGTARPHLRSDHAPDTARPEVRLELTLAGRRLEITRSPEWHRPKKRGTGTTAEKGAVILREQVGQRWETVTTRADEAGLLLQDLVGMRLDQFTKVVLLPQGEFAAFLRADAESRRGLLEQLFATRLYSDVEAWLSERRRALGREVAAVRSRRDELLARADEHAAQLPGPERSDEPGDPDEPTGSSEAAEAGPPGDGPAARLTDLAAHAAAQVETAAQEALSATADAEAAAAALATGRDLAARQARLATLAAEAAHLLDGEPEQEERRVRLARARRAAPLVPHLTTTARLDAEVQAAASALEGARAAVPAALSGAGRLAIETAAAEGRQELGRLTDAREAATALAEQRALQAEATGLATAAALSADAALAEQAKAGQRRTASLERLDQLKAAAARQPAAEAALHDLERLQRSLAARTRLEAEVATAEVSARERRDEALTLKEHWLTLRERRLAGIATELSAVLVDGEPCPVCGAHEHPAPAAANPVAVSEVAERAAQQAAFDADQALGSAREHLASLRSGLDDETRRAAGATVKGVKAQIATAKADLAATVDAADRVAAHAGELLALQGQVEELARLAARMRAESAAHAATATAAANQAGSLTARLERLRGADADVDARAARIEGEVVALSRLLQALTDHERLDEATRFAIADAGKACAAAGFDDLSSAIGAVLPDSEITALAESVAGHDELVAGVHAQLQDPALMAAAAAPPPVLSALLEAESAAAARRRAADQSHARVESARVALQRLAAELVEHEERSAGLLQESTLVDDLARCVEGTGGDNVLRMRLSSYVLASRLEEVAAAATERLLVMSDGRYSLVHTDALAKGGVRSGLGLRVVDGWTGVERDTATLSGGESFLASLSLALGLADAVQAEAGGAVMQTLFIDEGFGMLDEETLDEVMTVLDGLREGGRSVGLVSHVADLRTRIPAQLEVRKSRSGSRIVVQEAGAA